MSEVADAAPRRRRWAAALPFIGFAALAGLFAFQLNKGGDPSLIPSPLIGKKAPALNLPAVAGWKKPGLSDADLRQGHTTVVNIFASWCGPCRMENPVLKQLAENPVLNAVGVKLVGVDYKDDPANVAKFLNEDGDPYAAIGSDLSGRAGIDWGLTGVPETFIVRGDGTITYKYTGPLTEQALNAVLLPQIEKTVR
jgi:cytochrome c biogenesis protein CcmG, thiol:disulfide interchange protein DsbE